MLTHRLEKVYDTFQQTLKIRKMRLKNATETSDFSPFVFVILAKSIFLSLGEI